MSGYSITKDITPQRDGWNRLYAGYAVYYKVEQTQEMRDRVWGWIGEGGITCLMVVDDGGTPIGIAHVREFLRPLMSAKGGYLDDLFVDPDWRGKGVVQALLAAVAEEARQRQWSVVRWITREDNFRARAVYDRVATRTNWVTYDMPPASA